MLGDNNVLIQEARKCKYTLIPKEYNDEDVAEVWNELSAYIMRQLLQHKAVTIPGLGLFSVIRRTLNLGLNYKLLPQRPVFMLSEKFASIHNVTYTKHLTAGEIPLVMLNYSMISVEMGVDRDVAEFCIKEIISAFSRTLSQYGAAELCFKDIGKLVISNGKAKMKFTRDFLKSVLLDGRSASTLPFDSVIPNRPDTANSFISHNSIVSQFGRPITLALPSSKSRNAWITVRDGTSDRAPSVIGDTGGRLSLTPLNDIPEETNKHSAIKPNTPFDVVSMDNSRPQTVHTEILACDGGFELEKVHQKIDNDVLNKVSKTVEIQTNLNNAKEEPNENDIIEETVKPILKNNNNEKCNHKSGQELCYLCHQRRRRNIPISFTEEKKRKETHQDRLIIEYQRLKNQEFFEREMQYKNKYHEICKNDADYNLAAAERAKKERNPPNEFHLSHIFNRKIPMMTRSLTKVDYGRDLQDQMKLRSEKFRKERELKVKAEHEEQKCLAEELEEEKAKLITSKSLSTLAYRNALDYQLQNKPFRYPRIEPDGKIFGKFDITPEKMFAIRQRAKSVQEHQLQCMREKKEKSNLERERNIKYELEVLQRTRENLEDEALRRAQWNEATQSDLDNSWYDQCNDKLKREEDERKHRNELGELLVDQYHKYKRCNQCKKRPDNVGTTNLWKESRFPQGCKIMT